MVVCSPVERRTSISRSLGWVHTSLESLINESVTPDMAETTTTTLWPACWVSITRCATFLIRSGLPTEVPPYFWTMIAISRLPTLSPPTPWWLPLPAL